MRDIWTEGDDSKLLARSVFVLAGLIVLENDLTMLRNKESMQARQLLVLRHERQAPFEICGRWGCEGVPSGCSHENRHRAEKCPTIEVRGTGMPLVEYARRTLFEPMRFGPVAWAQGKDGEPFAASGLRLLPRDMLKVGQLILAEGDWLGRRLAPMEWIKKIITPIIGIDRVSQLWLSLVHGGRGADPAGRSSITGLAELVGAAKGYLWCLISI